MKAGPKDAHRVKQGRYQAENGESLYTAGVGEEAFVGDVEPG
jgi:hypothetical protein